MFDLHWDVAEGSLLHDHVTVGAWGLRLAEILVYAYRVPIALGRQDDLGSVALQAWPEVDGSLLVDDEIEIPVQVGGKIRARIMIPAQADATIMEAAALADAEVQRWLEGKTIHKVVAVPGRLVNIVAG